MRVFLPITAAILFTLGCLAPHQANAGGAVVRWTATGDDSIFGRATAYDLRYSLSPISASNFGSAMGVAGLPPPAPAGTRESFQVNGLQTGRIYYFAIKARDEVGNWSMISNLLWKPASGTVDVSERVAVLAFSTPRPNPARSGSLFVMQLPAAARVLVEAFDIQGRKVRVLADQEYQAGEFPVRWDLYDDNGVKLAPGMYRIRARLGSTTFVRSIAIVG